MSFAYGFIILRRGPRKKDTSHLLKHEASIRFPTNFRNDTSLLFRSYRSPSWWKSNLNLGWRKREIVITELLRSVGGKAYEEDLYEFTRTVARDMGEGGGAERVGRRASSRITQDARVFPSPALVHPDGNRPRKEETRTRRLHKGPFVSHLPRDQIPRIRSVIVTRQRYPPLSSIVSYNTVYENK